MSGYQRIEPNGNGKNNNGKQSPWDKASLLSKYSLYFMLPLIKKGHRQQLTLDDIGAPPRVDYSRTLGLRLQQNYNGELLNAKNAGQEPSFIRALFRTFGPHLLFMSIFDLLSKCIAFPMQTIALGWLIRDTGQYLELQQQQPTAAAAAAAAMANATTTGAPELLSQNLLNDAYWRIITDACLLMLFTISATILSHPFFFQSYHIGMKLRIASCYMIYKKSLKLSQSAMSETTVGQMVNLLSNDVNRFDQVAQMLPYIVLAPLQAIVVVLVLAIFYLGLYPTLASLATIVVYVSIQSVMGRGFSRFRAKTAKRTDERVRLMNEIILAMRIIKMYAWEGPFKELVNAARKREMTTIAIASILKAINQTLFFISSKVIVFSALITFVLLGDTFSPQVVFVTIGLANLIRISLTLFFPNAVAFCAETIVSCRRINKFLLLPEIGSPLQVLANYKCSSDGYGCKYALAMQKVYCGWSGVESGTGSRELSPAQAASMGQLIDSSNARWAIVRNLTLAIKPQDLVLIVGRVGSGKSSVLMAMLGELPVASGRLEVNGKISYASQEAWIFSGTVRDNILFGKPYEQDRYNEVLRVCSLNRDLEVLVEGDATVVGERGVSLSGGQKARVNLARALYAEADIYILDDPLSAVDAPVARHIFNECLRTFLRKRTVILATHQLQFLRHATKVLVVDRESPAAFGSLQEVMDSEAFKVIDYSKETFEDATTATETDGGGEFRRRKSRSPQLERSVEPPAGHPLARSQSLASSNLHESVGSLLMDQSGSVEMLPEQKVALKEQKTTTTTTTGTGRRQGELLSAISSNLSTYFYYVRNGAGVIMFTWFILTNVVAQTFYQFTDYFLSSWADSVQRKGSANFQPSQWLDQLTNGQISSLYGLLVLACLVSTLFRSVTFFAGTLRASINIHHRLFQSVIHAPMTFFDFSPIGILLNRLSRDIGFVDETLPAVAIEIVTIFVNIGGILVLVLIIDYKNLAAALLLIALAASIRSFCGSTITKLKQMEGVNRSPIFSHISTTLSGLPTIRAFRVQEEFVRMFDHQQDAHSSAWFNYICASRWLTVTMEWLCLVFIALVVGLLLAVSLDSSNASVVGLLISQVVVLPGPFQWGVRQLIEVESQMTSVQRIKEFSELEPEEDAGGQPQHAHFSAQVGQVKFTKLSLRYFPDELPVLRDISFSVEAGEKVGVVGRTGAGKSSIVSVLFRLYNFEGSVEIDGTDTRLVPLGQLRKTISIIPQEPVLFGGTIRKNLDPFNEHSDERLWSALEAVQLKPLVARHPQQLEFGINEGGSNFSVGQRQLICLARAIVRRNKILVLDEATANVDPETDSFIQKTIADQFAQCTVITIAHRLITIVNSDRVLVLDHGQVKEFAAPYELLQNESSLFRQMVDSSGQQAARIRKTIELEHQRRTASKID